MHDGRDVFCLYTQEYVIFHFSFFGFQISFFRFVNLQYCLCARSCGCVVAVSWAYLQHCAVYTASSPKFAQDPFSKIASVAPPLSHRRRRTAAVAPQPSHLGGGALTVDRPYCDKDEDDASTT